MDYQQNGLTARGVVKIVRYFGVAEQSQDYMVPLKLPRDISAEKFGKHEKKKLSSCKVFAMVTAGDSMAGKSSLVMTLLEGKSHLVPEEKRTRMAQVLQWKPEGEEDIVFLVYDLGGHPSYRAMCHCFQMNSKASVCILVHNIENNTMSHYQSTFNWLKIIHLHAPESHVFVALTQMDKVADAGQEELVNEFVGEFVKLIDREIGIIHGKAKEAKKKVSAEHLKNYQSVREQLKASNFLRLSCVPEKVDSVGLLRTKLLTHALQMDNEEVLLQELEKEFFATIGTIGLKDPIFQQPEQLSSDDEYWDQAEMSDLDEFMSDESDVAEEEEPEVNIQQYVSLSDAVTVYQETAKHLGEQITDPVEDTKRILIKLSNRGFLRYFVGDKDLEEVVFNNISTLVAMIRAIFHHEQWDVLKFENLDYEHQELYQHNTNKFLRDLRDMRKFGVVSISLLQVLLKRVRCTVDVNAVAQLLQKLDAGFSINEKDGKHKIFVPSLSMQKLKDEEVQGHEKELSKCSQQTLSLHAEIRGNTVESLFHMLLVKVFEYFGRHEKAIKPNIAWEHGAIIKSVSKSMKLLIHHNIKQDKIVCIFQGDIKDINVHTALFDSLGYLNNTFSELQKSKYPGLLPWFVLLCSHCRISPSHVSSGTIDEWDIEELLSDPQPCYRCEFSEEDIPGGLLAPIPVDLPEEQREMLMDKVREYLRKACTCEEEPGIYPFKACKLRIAKMMIRQLEFMDILGDAKPDYAYHVGPTVLTRNTVQEIQRCQNDSEAWGKIHDALYRSYEENMIEELIKALRTTGQIHHADRLQALHREEIRAHECTDKCKQ